MSHLQLNNNGYKKAEGIGGETHKLFKMDVKRLSELFRDTFYTGVLMYGESQKIIVNLTEIYDFVPMIEVDDFLKINKFDNIERALRQRVKGSAEGSIKADLLRGMIICGYCDEAMTSGITPKRSTNGTIRNYFYYRCDTPKCKFKGKSVRAKVIVNFAIEFLENHKFTSKSIYDDYVAEMKNVIDQKEKELESRRRGLTIEKRLLEDRIEKTKNLLLDETDPYIKDTFKKELKAKEGQLVEILDKIEEVRQAREKNKQTIYSYEEFLELFGNLPVTLRKTKTLKEKDFVIKKIFLNFTAKDKNVLSYQLNQPFDRFIKEGKFRSSRNY